MGELRIILLVIGIAVLIAVYWLSKPRKPRQAREREAASPAVEQAAPPRTRERLHARADDPDPENLSLELERLGRIISRDRHEEDAPAPPAEPKAEAAYPAEPPERIVVVYVRTRGDERISGDALQNGTRKVGLEYGSMDIYHRLDEAGRREPIFSLANMTPPGTLDQAQSAGFTTPGVTLFMQLPGPVSGLDGLDAMLAAAQRLAQLWGAEVLDENRCSLTRQRIQQMREEMREFDRRHSIEIPNPE